jgi:superfamily II DNA or RNA helicase
MSLARHYQKVGRLTRPHKDKDLGYLIDLSGNTKRFGRVEYLEIRQVGTTYHVFSGDKQLSGVTFTDIIEPKPKKVEVFKDLEFTFGKFKGTRISETPTWYLSWVIDNINWNVDLVKNARLFLDQQK